MVQALIVVFLIVSPFFVPAGVLVIAFLAVSVYFLPGAIAKNRHHHNAGAIWALNILLGWTMLGWIGALVWALTAVKVLPEPSASPDLP